ncbi:DUF2087 domain-containing protein [Rhizobium sp. FKL33]|uniref:DUF2087 domain-containing protein n=1 Tax=Rhizobium sp. FKL33 TaxID=2562307 RepID=UPI0010C07A4B|nr:DUF2087 domain-containing protein [Rhizobium sp. FKL33]
MSRTLIPLAVSDASSFAKSLRTQLREHEGVPSHLELLNMLARAAGYGNFQSLRATVNVNAIETLAPIPESDKAAPKLDLKLVERVARCFDTDGRLTRWPSRRSDQIVALWVLWSQFPSAKDQSEPEVNVLLRDRHLFGDHALLRRELCDMGLLSRTPNGGIYRRIERPMPPDAANVARRLR